MGSNRLTWAAQFRGASGITCLVVFIVKSFFVLSKMMVTYIYVYKLNNDCYYVGQTASPYKRYAQHEKGEGAVWTRLHGGAVLVECNRRVVKNKEEADAAENIKTLQLMQRYGWKNVRGGWFCNVDEVLTEKGLRHHKVFDLVSTPSKMQSAPPRQ